MLKEPPVNDETDVINLIKINILKPSYAKVFLNIIE
jgi:hypothetical protein